MVKSIELKKLKVNVDDKEILHGIDLKINKGEIHVLMGPNGAGKSTISNSILGLPKYNVVSGEILYDGESVIDLDVNERAKQGVFLSFQSPIEIEGVTFVNFLRTTYNAFKGEEMKMTAFHKMIKEKMKELNMDPSFRTRSVNVGFSGGEKKRSEILQLSLLEPDFALLDELDSGLDVDALKLLSTQVLKIKEKTNMGILLVTHHSKILKYLKPDFVHVMKNGKIIQVGGMELVDRIESKGFEF